MSIDRGRLRILRDAAGHIADGEAVDWPRVKDGHDDLGVSLDGLRLLADIAAVHRSPLPEEQPFEETGPPENAPPAPRPDEEDAPVPQSWGRLQVGPLLGKGSSGNVYRAHDPALRKDVALKLLRTERSTRDGAEERFLTEARRLARVHHENVVVVHGADRHAGQAGMWTDLIEGRTLEDQIRSQGNLNAREASVVGQHLCRALAAVHAAGLVHRDVKTRNIMRRRADGQIILMDFSSAARRAPSAGDAMSGNVAGTPLFAAPEVLRGKEAEVTADVYSLGVVLYRLVTGTFPVEAETMSELREKHDRRDTVPLMDRRPDLDPAFIQVVEKAIHPDPARRYASMAEMERDLARVLILPPVPRANRWWPLVTGAAMLATVVALWVYPPPTGPLSATVELARVAAAGGYQRLTPGSTVFPGDYLTLEVQGSESMHVYALNVDPSGEAIALFPLADVALTNPLAAGMGHRLPGLEKGKQTYYQISRQRGVDSFYVFLSAEPLPEAARLIGMCLPVSPPGASTTGERDGPRGISGRAVPGPEPRLPKDEEAARLLRHLLELSDRNQKVRAWQIAVENQG
jgi:tRNA A-37 threonylcarbamoyl transferase component Bud32